MPKGKALVAADLGLGYLAKREEIARFGTRARKIIKIKHRGIDQRSFAEVAREKMQGKGGQSGYAGYQGHQGGARGSNRWDQERSRREEGDNRRSANPQHTREGQGRQEFQGDGGYGGNYQGEQDFRGRNEGVRDRAQEERGAYQRRYGQRNPNLKRTYDDRDMQGKEGDLREKLLKNKDEFGRDNEIDYKKHERYTSREKFQNYDQEGQKEMLCYNCNMTGHHQGTCTNPPFCYNCKSSGHKAMACPMKKGLTLCGYGFPGAAFHAIHCPTKQKTIKKEVMGIMTILEGNGDIVDVDMELAHLFRDKDNWKIKEISDNEFLITFPDEDMRRQLTRFKNFGFETGSITAKVKATEIPAEASSVLQSIWVKVYNWDPEARLEQVVREIAYMAGEPEAIDMQSLNRDGPIKIKVAVRDPRLITGETEVFFNSVGRKLTWIVEDMEGSEKGNKTSSSSKFDRHKEKGNEDDEDEDRQLAERDHDPGFVAMAKELKAGNRGQCGGQVNRKHSGASEGSEAFDENTIAQEECEKPVIRIEDSQEDLEGYESDPIGSDKVESKGDDVSAEKKEMERIERVFKEKATRMAPMLNLPKGIEGIKHLESIAMATENEGGESQEGEAGSQVIDEEGKVTPRKGNIHQYKL